MTRRLVPAVLALVLLGTAAACGGGDEDPAAAATSPSTTAAPSAPTTTAAVQIPGITAPDPALPTDFPRADVPLLAGQVSQPLGPGSSGVEGKKGWVVEVKVAKTAAECFDAAAAQLVAKGFTLGAERTTGTLKEAQFTGPGYAVIVSTSPTDDGGCRLGYEVGQVSP